ncbi:MAG: hypothetical protein IPM33_13625 [Phycisphaerales bacterium]|nr:hypothetical protein [Phycisphaerales bacterium]
MLRITFFGVGDGDCIVIEFPDSSVGVVDSRSRPGSNQSPAIDLVRGKKLAFCCMTHPHADHYRGLREVLEVADTTGWQSPLFWHTLSDLDKIASDLFRVIDFDGKDPATLAQEKADLDYLSSLFTWIATTHGSGFAESVRQITHRRVAGVEISLAAPSTAAWSAYSDGVKKCRAERRTLRYGLANDISLGLLLEYGGTRVWLLGDLGSGEQLSLVGRMQAAMPRGIAIDVHARVLKVAHHGAKNSWDPSIPKSLTVCESTDIIVLSADGSDHPDRDVFNGWLGTGKQVIGTWQPNAAATQHAKQSEWFDDTFDLIAPLCSPLPPRDIEVVVQPDGTHSHTFNNVP